MALPDIYGYKRYWYKAKTWNAEDSWLKENPIAYGILYPPNYDPNKAYPLLIGIPGSGEIGEARPLDTPPTPAISATPGKDNTLQWRWGLGVWMRKTEDKNSLYQTVNNGEGCVTIIIQSYSSSKDLLPDPLRYSWDGHPDVKYNARPFNSTLIGSFFNTTVIDFIRDLLSNNLILHTDIGLNTIDSNTILPKIDESRIYCTGGSWGGGATLSLLTMGRDIFAAGVIYEGWLIGSPRMDYSEDDMMMNRLIKMIERIQHIPIVLLQGDVDNFKFSHKNIVESYPGFNINEKCILVHDITKSSHGSTRAWQRFFSNDYFFIPIGNTVFSSKRSRMQVTGVKWLFSRVKEETPIDPYPPKNKYPAGYFELDAVYLNEEDNWEMKLNTKYKYMPNKTNIIRHNQENYIFDINKDKAYLNEKEIKDREEIKEINNRIIYRKDGQYIIYKKRNKKGIFKG